MNELIYIGYNPSHKGTIFLTEIIQLAITRNNIEDYCLNTDLYPVIAEKHYININLIKVDIFKATEFMYYNCEMSKFNKYFNFDSKPNVKDIIYKVASNVLNKNY